MMMERDFSDNEEEFVDTNRVIKPEPLNMSSVAMALPDVPTHQAGTKAVRPTPEDNCRAKLAVVEDTKIQSDDDDDDENDGDYQPQEENSEKKKRKRGPNKTKSILPQVNHILDALQNMQRLDRTEAECKAFISSLVWTDKKINEFKLGLTNLMQISNKSATATESAMMRYLTSLENEHPEAIIAEQCRDMSYPSLKKATTSVEEQIYEAEQEVKRLKNSLKIHKFFLEIHQEQTHDRCSLMAWFFRGIAEIESTRFLEAASKTSARKEFGRRGGGRGGRSNEI
jgi:hypothetical protein